MADDEINGIIQLYLEDSEFLEEKLDEISLKLTENIQNQLYRGHGRITGNLRDNIKNSYEVRVKGLEGVVQAYIGDSAPYGALVDEGHLLRNGAWWEGYHFMEAGLEETLALYR